MKHDKRTSYIALEFEWCTPDIAESKAPATEKPLLQQNGQPSKARYLTIGLSLYGNEAAATRIQPMYFLITDGSRLIHRVGGSPLPHTIELTYTENDKLHTFSQHVFKEKLKGHGMICDTQEKYAEAVSRHLFGFDEPSKFHKLIELLLVLRRPNPSDELTLASVQQHLTDSLPSIPMSTTKDAAETIIEINALQQQIMHLEQEHQAISDLHAAQQMLALSVARIAGSTYMSSQQQVEHLENLIRNLLLQISKLEAQKQQASITYDELNAEKQQIAGKIAALETSESIKLPQQITEAQDRVNHAREQIEKQHRSLDRSQEKTRTFENRLTVQSRSIKDQLKQSQSDIRKLHTLIAEKALWHDLAFQFQQGLEHIVGIESDYTNIVEHIQKIALLTTVETAERLSWLRELDSIHLQRQNLDQTIERTQADENRWQREVNRVFGQFRGELTTFYQADHQVELVLERIATRTDSITANGPDIAYNFESQADALDTVLEETPQLSNLDEVDSYLQQCRERLQQHSQYIDAIMPFYNDMLQRVEREIKTLRQQQTLQQHMIHEQEKIYERKKAQPEFLPIQPTHRSKAREKLTMHNISAFPLYALIDFAPDIDGEEAGRIEHMLEDAGLLDALVLLETDVPAADTLLREEGLSDCHLNIEVLKKTVDQYISETDRVPVSHLLQFDEAIQDMQLTTYDIWEVSVKKIIPLLEGMITAPSEQVLFAYNTSDIAGRWQHGLLIGQSSGGKAQFIGRTARQRMQQQEQAELAQQLEELRRKLDKHTDYLVQQEALYNKLVTEQEEIRTVLINKNLTVSYQKLENTYASLGSARKSHEEAQEQTKRIRQERNRLTIQLGQQSGHITLFAHEHEKVQGAIQAIYELNTQVSQLQYKLANVLTLHEEMLKTQSDWEDAKFDEAENQAIYSDMQEQLIRDESILAERQRIAASPEVKNLSLQLGQLRTRSKEIEADVITATQVRAEIDGRLKNLAEKLTERETELQPAQTKMRSKQTLFVDLLNTYPTIELQDARMQIDNGDYIGATRVLKVEAQTQEHLEQELRDTQDILMATYNKHVSMLHDYGPELDQKRHFITFSQANGTTPYALLSILETNSKKQQDLLRDEEGRLFESFLLNRMTEMLYKYIQKAKEWVDDINKPLSTVSTVGDRYELEWHIRTHLDANTLGKHLAKHYKLFSKPAMKLLEQERSLLKEAFSQEINTIWLSQGDTNGMNFEQRLQAIFDYRQWFQFKVYVTPKGGQKQPLDNKLVGSHSGAERLFDLLIPLLAALSALYNSAADGAPRLLALDEAFDRASFKNMKLFIEYLAEQNFQWIMTGPQLNISGANVPVSIRYLMLHEKGKSAATAVPKIWQSSLNKGFETQ